jgi:uncharacterized membrane protein
MPTTRFDAIDALRGLALVWMAAFHLCFDLSHFGLWRQDFYNDPVWTWQRSCILGGFLFCAGLGQAVARHQGQTWARFWRRWTQIVACAGLVTAGSALMFPGSYIYFGVLHGIAVMLVIVRLTGAWGTWLWLAGALAIGTKFAAAQLLVDSSWAALFDTRGLNWLGLVTARPVTEDYVPLVPWLGLMWWGMAAGQWLLHKRRGLLDRLLPPAARPLAVLGRWSLTFYMLHQPLLIGGLMLLAGVRA